MLIGNKGESVNITLQSMAFYLKKELFLGEVAVALGKVIINANLL